MSNNQVIHMFSDSKRNVRASGDPKQKEMFRELIQTRVFTRSTEQMPIIPRGRYAFRDSPWFFDFRAIAFEPSFLTFFAETFWHRYGDAYPFQVGGLESASLPLITAIVLKGAARGTPIHGFFMRKSRKRDGLLKMFEGGLTDDPVILVDDSINSGQSLYRQVLALIEAKKTITDIFTALAFRDTHGYGFAAEHGIRINSIFSLTDFGIPLLASKAPEVAQQHFDVLWQFKPAKASFNFVVEKSAPLFHEDTLFLGSDEGVFYALDAKTGSVRWKFEIDRHPHGKGIFSSPIAYKSLVYFGGYDGNVYALDTKTGTLRWIYAEADWIGSSPALAPDLGLLFIGMEFGLPWRRGGIVALDCATGARVWGKHSRAFTHGSPLYLREEHMVVVGSNDGILYAYDAASGKKRWQFETGGEIKSCSAYDPKRHLVCVASWDGHLYIVRAEDGILVCKFETKTPLFSTPLVVGDIVYLASLDKYLYAIDLKSGKKRWEFGTNGRIFASPVLKAHSLWIGSNDGRLYELDPESGELRSFFQAVERIVNAIAYEEKTDRLFVPTVANELYCIQKRK